MRSKRSYLKRILSSYILSYKTSNLAFWHSPLKVNELTERDLHNLGAYPQNFESKIGLIDSVDEAGVILLDYKGDLGLQYNPNAIAQLALGYYDRILSSNEAIDKFLIQAEYFLSHGREEADNVFLWEYKFPFEMRNYLHSPWRSALAQGQGISVCLRAFSLTGNDQYLDAAKRAFNSFRYLAREHPGGVLDDSEGYTWLEEYIVEPPNHVLNGFIWALWGVREYSVFLEDDYAHKLWNSCLETLKENLIRYDLGFWTTYDLLKPNNRNLPVMPCSVYYQKLHVIQMIAMHNLTSDPVFKLYSEKWGSQLEKPFNRIVSQIWKGYFKLRWF